MIPASPMSPDEPHELDETKAWKAAEDANPSPSFDHPSTLGPYSLELELGRGGMGIVYAAKDERLHRRVALKMLRNDPIVQADPEDRLAQEARHLAALNHPNIATVYSLECIDGHRFFSLEYIQGITLKEALRIKQQSTADMLELFKQIAEALHFAHQAGIAHCDLKPANVMIDGRGSAKILDFGIARVMRGGSESESGDQVSGTPGYMSPEQIRGQTPDQQADVWAFGCMLFEALAGRPAFPGGDTDAVILGTLQEDPDWNALPKQLPGRLKEIMRGCLQKAKESRTLCLQRTAGTLHDVAHSLSWQQEDGLVSKALTATKKVGDKAPKFELRGSDGQLIRLGEQLAKGPVILTFYRGSWCSICTSELQGFEHMLTEIRELGGSVLGISPQTLAHNRDLVKREGLNFDLLSDPGNIVASKYGIAVELPPDLRRYHSSLGLDLAQFNGDNSWVLPMPATFLVDQGRVVRYAAVTGDPTLRPDPRECVELLRGLGT